jgi:hypothetical protein
MRDTAPISPTNSPTYSPTNSLGMTSSDRREQQQAQSAVTHPPTTLPMTNTPRRRVQEFGPPATPTVTLSASGKICIEYFFDIFYSISQIWRE